MILRIHIVFMCFLFSMSALAQDLLSFYDGEQMHLRWKAAKAQNLEAYRLYVDKAGDWTLIAENKRLVKSKDLAKTIGAGHELFAQLAGLQSLDQDFTAEKYNALLANEEAYDFFAAFTGLDIHMAEAMGEVYRWKPETDQVALKLKVSIVANGIEADYLEAVVNSQDVMQVQIPQGLQARALDNKVRLLWTAPKDRMQAIGAHVYRSSSLLGPYTILNPMGSLNFELGEEDSYTDNYLENGRTYFYYLKYFNAFGMEGEPSEIIKVKVGDDAAGYLSGLIVESKGERTYLSWPEDSLLAYQIYRAPHPERNHTLIYPPSELIKYSRSYYLDRDAEAGVLYSYHLIARDQNGKKYLSDTVLFSLEDRDPPMPPLGLEGSVTSNGLMKLWWDPNAEPDLLGYEVERFTGDSGVNNFLLTAKPIETNSFSESLGSESQSAYRYVVYALDQSYNRSDASDAIRLRRPDDIPPPPPIVNEVREIDGLLEVGWTRNFAEDFDHFNVYKKQNESKYNLLLETVKPKLQDSLKEEGSFVYKITAVDRDGNESQASRELRFDFRPEESMLPPSNGTVADSSRGIFLSWEASKDQRKIGYVVERFDPASQTFMMVAELDANATSYLDRYANKKEPQRYRIIVHDKDWFTGPALELSYEPQN